MKDLDKKHLTVALILLVIIMPYYFFKLYYLFFFKIIFESNFSYWVLGVCSLILNIMHKLKFRDEIVKEDISFIDFKDVFEVLFNPALIVTAFSLAKGLFLQHFFNGDYYRNFSDLEIILLTVVVAYVLLVSFLQLKKFAIESLKKTEKVKPLKQDEGNKFD